MNRDVTFSEEIFPFQYKSTTPDTLAEPHSGYSIGMVYDDLEDCNGPGNEGFIPSHERGSIELGPAQHSHNSNPISDHSVEDMLHEEQGGVSTALWIEAQLAGRSTMEPELQTEAPSPALTERGPAQVQGVQRGGWPRKRLVHLDDFVCYDARVEDPISLATASHTGSSGTHYPIISCVTSANFSLSHKKYLATITKVVEPRFYSEALKDPQ